MKCEECKLWEPQNMKQTFGRCFLRNILTNWQSTCNKAEPKQKEKK